MSTLNKTGIRSKGTTPIKGTGNRAVNGEGALGFERDAKSELFLASVTSLNENTFYETANERIERTRELVKNVADDVDWLTGLVSWLRGDGGLRTSPQVVALMAVHERLDNGLTGGNRGLIRAAIRRVDEAPAMLAGWIDLFGKPVPAAVKRGVADALVDLLNEVSYLKWNGKAKAGSVSLRDAILITHPKARTAKQNALFKYIIDTEYGNENNADGLDIIKARIAFNALTDNEKLGVLHSSEADDVIKDAALTHEVVSSSLNGNMDAGVWANLVPHMGYQALLMNLRRLSEAHVDASTHHYVASKIASADASYKLMPLSFYSAYKNTPGEWSEAVEHGSHKALENVPSLKGKTLILLDKSSSMDSPLSEHSSLTRYDAAKIFAVALAMKAEAYDLYMFNGSVEKAPKLGENLLRNVKALGSANGWTDTVGAVKKTYDPSYARIVLITDEQASYFDSVGGVFAKIPKNTPTFTWNISGYKVAESNDGPYRFTFGGLTDTAFSMIPYIEDGLHAAWPWEENGASDLAARPSTDAPKYHGKPRPVTIEPGEDGATFLMRATGTKNIEDAEKATLGEVTLTLFSADD